MRRDDWWFWGGLLLGVFLIGGEGWAQTVGTARLEVTLKDYNGSGARHWTVVWVTTEAGAFIKTLWRQGPSLGSGQWNSHCSAWYSAKAGSTAFDGYSSATAQSYAGTNSPVILTWNGRGAAGAEVPDGRYKFWVQYAEDSGQGPYTTGGLLWTKGAVGATNTYANQGANFAAMKVVWSPELPPAPPVITSVAREGADLVLSGEGPAGRAVETLFSGDLGVPLGQWALVRTNQVDGAGRFRVVYPMGAGSGAGYFRVRIP